ncbi:hypothetical protein GN958_ATG13846 [Phytophthora infestans]|uniref:Uncharacterized protein n=1 Tax=Phytophthora infestans TaxID=4787 RepID=A0A8S9UBT5_PHYIN|nr:hypothetical protein GN958_ATG13846 [Phytophthora infestans]
MMGQGKKGHAAEPVTRKCLPALKNRNYIGHPTGYRIYYLVGYTLGALNFQDPVTGGGKYDAKELQRQGNTPARQPYGQIHDLGPGSISSNIRLGYGTIHGRRVKIFHCCSTPSPRLAKTLKLHHLNSSEVTERADPALPTGTQGEESSAEHGSSGDPLR